MSVVDGSFCLRPDFQGNAILPPHRYCRSGEIAAGSLPWIGGISRKSDAEHYVKDASVKARSCGDSSREMREVPKFSVIRTEAETGPLCRHCASNQEVDRLMDALRVGLGIRSQAGED